MASYASGFDASLLTCADAARAVAEAAAIEGIAATIKALAAARAAESNSWRHDGHRSAAEALSRQTGTSLGAAREALDTGRRLESQPELSAAARAGELSPSQATLVADATEADPGAAPRLIDQAKRTSLAELREEVSRTKAAAEQDLEARRAAIRARRRLRSWTDPEGVWHLHALGNPEDGAQVMAALRPITDEIFAGARQEGRREPPEAYAFDALVQLATDRTSVDATAASPCTADSPAPLTAAPPSAPPAGSPPASEAPAPTPTGSPPASEAPAPPPTGSPPVTQSPALPRAIRRRLRRGTPVKLLVRIDYDTWLRGVAAPGETCELVGYGPVAVSVVRDLVETGDPFVAAILAKGRELVGVAHLGRQPTAHQQSALEWLYPSCAAEGCPARARLQRDHRVDWAKTHFTMLDLLDLLCAHHHHLKTRAGWALVPGTGKRAFVPPGDPRHPKHHGSMPPPVAA